MLLKKKVSVITGALGAIGQTMTRMFLREGALVIGTDLDKAVREEEAFIERVGREFGDRYIFLSCDISKVEEIRSLGRKISERGLVPEILVNNAGINYLGYARDVTEENWDHILEVNLKGAFFMSQCIGKLMMEGKGGAIVNIASQHGEVANLQRAPYCASKAGLINLTRALCLEWAEYGIRVNSVLPTFVLTEKNEQMLMQSGRYRTYMREIPLRRYATAEDVANAVLFFVSDRASMITGQALAVDGGYLAK